MYLKLPERPLLNKEAQMKELLSSVSAGIIFNHCIDEFLHVFPNFHSYTTKKKKSTLMKSALDSGLAVFFPSWDALLVLRRLLVSIFVVSRMLGDAATTVEE